MLTSTSLNALTLTVNTDSKVRCPCHAHYFIRPPFVLPLLFFGNEDLLSRVSTLDSFCLRWQLFDPRFCLFSTGLVGDEPQRDDKVDDTTHPTFRQGSRYLPRTALDTVAA